MQDTARGGMDCQLRLSVTTNRGRGRRQIQPARYHAVQGTRGAHYRPLPRVDMIVANDAHRKWSLQQRTVEG
jgi:hypothetical protein